MKSLQRATALALTAAVFLTGAAASRAQVNGNATINAPGPVFGQPLSVGTSSQFAGAVSSVKWGGKEFINNWDHGRQLQLNSQFFNRFICYNPYEAGSLEDGSGPTSTSKLLSLTAGGNRLDSETQMAWYYRTFGEYTDAAAYCGDPAQWLPVKPYTTPLSDYRVRKTVTIGFQDIPNVIEYAVDHFIPEPVLKGLNNITAVLNYEFSSLRSWDVVSKDYREIRALTGEDDRIKVASTADGNYAMGWYAPELLQPYSSDAGAVNWWFVVPPNPAYTDPKDPSKPDPDYACVHFGTVDRYDSFGPGWYPRERALIVVGNLDHVKESLARVHSHFALLDPEVFNWRDYIAINGLGGLNTREAAQAHWLSPQGFAQGLRGSRTFFAPDYLQLNSDVAGAFGATNYQAAIQHFVDSGRAEGRSTTAKVSTGMQHLLVSSQRIVQTAGQNTYGQLGDPTAASSPARVFSLDNSVTEIASGDYTSFAVKNDGSLWMWGSNQYGARGDGSSGDNIVTPVPVPVPARITTPSRTGKHAVAAGTGAYAAIDTQGHVWTWGVNWNGRLGDGTTDARYTPARVRKSGNGEDYLTGVVSITIGGGTMAAIDADGNVWTWGAGANGSLGNGFTDDSSYAVQVVQGGNGNSTTPLAGVTQVACGSSGFCIALTRSGTVFGWGSNEFSQLGFDAGGALSIATPIGVDPTASIDAIAVGAAHAIAHSRDGNVYGWGYNGRGQLGLGFASVAQAPPAVMNAGPDNMNNISDLAAGANFSVMVRDLDRAVFVAGDNQSGQLGSSSAQAIHSLPVRSSF